MPIDIRPSKILKILDAYPAEGPRIPFIFNGVDGPRYIGHVHGTVDADMLLALHRLSATRLSTATVGGDPRKFVIAH